MGMVRSDHHRWDAARSLSGKRLYTCDNPDCDVRRVPWRNSWIWYGSYKDIEDDPFAIPTFCSDACKQAATKRMKFDALDIRNG